MQIGLRHLQFRHYGTERISDDVRSILLLPNHHLWRLKNLVTGLLLLAVSLLVLVAWFMYGQGWDRASAAIVVQRSFLLIPVLALALTFSSPFEKVAARFFGSKKRFVTRYLHMLVIVSALCLLGFGLPYLVVFKWQQPPSPFEELWMMMGGTAVLMGGAVYWIVKPAQHRHWFALAYLAVTAGILLGSRAFVFSFF